MYDINKALRKEYINWHGKQEERIIYPLMVTFQEFNEWHGEDVWILTAFDFVKEDIREFNLQDFV